MKKSETQTLFIISTDATRTGTPILLLNILNWLKHNSSFKFIFLLQEGGELMEEYKKLGQVYIWADIIYSSNLKISCNYLIIKILKKFRLITEKQLAHIFIRRIQIQNNIVLTYCNSTRNGYILSCIKGILPSKILLHVHEGEKILNNFNKNGLVSYALEASDSIIAVSNFVRDTLYKAYGIQKQIKVIPGCINADLKPEISAEHIKASLNLNQDAFVIMCAGWLDWHKGVDFFIQLALKYAKTNSNVYLIWLGGNPDNSTYNKLVYDIDKMEIGQQVRLISNVANPIDYYNIADIFLVLSREESFSLVTIEAGLLKKPILCFNKSGGPCEIVNFDSRFILPYGDIDKLFERTNNLLKNESERRQMGSFLKDKIFEQYVISEVGPLILNELNTMKKNSQKS